ncbi:acyl-CoA dehydrogenase domain-containing protein [Thecamonas trahens ATCC 50062]|uniref:Acyl-coenzyme A dehydrogenase n=1 Tax=Thecamonas trahens ATCC 50062 TaxID=461836 RepID=A0A0L0DBM4_THETB|nr:acyl-CoA dehydrogenase domain-containing protein [Thecamonas trahens ATCC 50062]KNC49744.1 acyl-CoA dehydrogenase domain-containing protein [Thecamonas trahens ATCC 50062]|eukprot:XP_013757531.1 acyl-CoA dehydrogenase domain-containing protein [Thecamonas trahens ATCC 50062]
MFSIRYAASTAMARAVATAATSRTLLATAPTGLGARTIFNYAYKVAKKVTPKISETERDALEAGTVGFDQAVYAGDTKAFDVDTTYREVKLTAAEQSFMDNEVNTLCKMIDDYQVNEDKDLPVEVWNYIRSKGFMGLCISPEFGGLGFSQHAHALIIERIATRSAAGAVSVMVPNSLGPAELLQHFGTQEQKDFYLPRLAKGVDIPCFGLTGPTSGSDAATMRDRGVVVERDGKLGIVASFSKRYITLAPVASLVGLAIDVTDPDGLLTGINGAKEGISVALLPRSHPGLEMGPRHDPMGLAFMNGTVQGEEVFIPLDMMMGGPERVGSGWAMLMAQLSIGRSVSLVGGSVAASTYAANVVGAYARLRKQFKVPVAELEGVKEPLARIASTAYTLKAGQTFIDSVLENGEKPSVLSAVMKYESTERAFAALSDAMNVLAGKGLIAGPKAGLSFDTAVKAAHVGRTVEGASILGRSLIIYGSGVVRAHPHMLPLIQSVNHGNDPEGFKSALLSLVKHGVTNTFGSLLANVTRSRSKSNLTSYYESQLGKAVSNFAIAADLTLALGGALKRKEFVSGRMADAFSTIYLAHATLWYHKQNRVEGGEVILEHAMDQLLFEFQEALTEVARNFPMRPLGWAMRALTFPFGKPYKRPSDKQVAAVSSLITHDTPVRQLLSKNMFVDWDSEDDQVSLLNRMLDKAVRVDDIYRDVRKTGRALTDSEQALVDEVEAARERIIQVDSFHKLGKEIHEGPDYVRPALRPYSADAAAEAVPAAAASSSA